jgi:hypothetical protein
MSAGAGDVVPGAGVSTLQYDGAAGADQTQVGRYLLRPGTDLAASRSASTNP